MDGAAVTDMILRAVAALREQGELPEMEPPRISVTQVTNSTGLAYHANIGPALAEAQTAQSNALTAENLARRVADYLEEVVDLVPAYHDIAAIALAPNGSLIITMR